MACRHLALKDGGGRQGFGECVAEGAPVADRLRTKVADLQLSNVDVVQAGFLTYQHGGDPADVVYSRYALHHLLDAWKAIALTKIRAPLRAGGLLWLWDVVYDFPPEDAEDKLEA